jgi:hypothetical protein
VFFGPNATQKYTTTYFRTAFVVEDPSRVSSLSLGLLRDDGAVLYVNGQEGFRDNMPTGTILHTTPALDGVGGAGETTYFPRSFDPGLLQAGTNLVAVEVHQHLPHSSDLGLDLFLVAEEVRSVTQGIADRTVQAGEEVRFFAAATDADLPSQLITYGLAPGAPAAAQIDPATGRFLWTPTDSDGPAQVPITITATDSGQLPLSDARSFTVTVLAPFSIVAEPTHPGQIGWPAIPGDYYEVEYADQLNPPEWILLEALTATLPEVVVSDPTAGQATQRYYRVHWQR